MGSGAHPASHSVVHGGGGLGCKADCSTPSSVEIKTMWSCESVWYTFVAKLNTARTSLVTLISCCRISVMISSEKFRWSDGCKQTYISLTVFSLHFACYNLRISINIIYPYVWFKYRLCWSEQYCYAVWTSKVKHEYLQHFYDAPCAYMFQ